VPVINGSTGETAMGLTSLVSVDGVVPAVLVAQAALKPKWLDAAGRVLLYVRENPPATFFAQSLDLDTSTLATVSAAPVTSVIGGDSVWAVYDATYGVLSSVGGLGPFVNAGLVEVNAVGSTAILTNATAGGLTVYDDTGARVFTIAGPVTAGTARLRGNYLSWLDPSTGWQIYDLTTSAQVEWQRRLDDITALVPVVISSKLYVVEQFTNGANQVITIRGAAVGTGFTVATAATAFGLDVVSTASGIARIAWSTTTAEALTDLRVALVTIGSGAFSLGTTAAGALAFTAQTALRKKQYAVSPYGGSAGALIEMLDHPFVQPSRVLTTEWHKALARLFRIIGQPVNLNTGVTGTLPPINGGTGTGTGTTVIDGSQIIAGSTPLSALVSQAASTLVGRGSASAGSPQVITLGAGVAMTGTVFSATGLGGDVVGPASATDNAVARFDGTTGKLIQNSTAIVSDAGALSIATIDLGAADTTLSRSSAGVLAVEGVNVLTTATGQPLDATLTALAAYNTNGLMTQTSADTFTGRTITGTADQIDVANGSGVAGNPTLSLPAAARTKAIGVTIDGGGVAITTGIKADMYIPFACTITAATLLADQTGSIVIDIWGDPLGSYPPTDADSITSATPPTITTNTNSQDTTLSSWTTAIAAGDTLRFNVDSVTSITRVNLTLTVTT
jgi:hypothetical protein